MGVSVIGMNQIPTHDDCTISEYGVVPSNKYNGRIGGVDCSSRAENGDYGPEAVFVFLCVVYFVRFVGEEEVQCVEEGEDAGRYYGGICEDGEHC